MKYERQQIKDKARIRPTRLVSYPYRFHEWYRGEPETRKDAAVQPGRLRGIMETPRSSRMDNTPKPTRKLTKPLEDVSSQARDAHSPRFQATAALPLQNAAPHPEIAEDLEIHIPDLLAAPDSAHNWFDDEEEGKGAARKARSVSQESSARLMQLSGMMRAVRVPPPSTNQAAEVEEYWPEGIKQTGPLPVTNLYGKEPFGKTLPRVPAAKTEAQAKPMPWWRALLNTPAAKVSLGLLIGVGLLFLVAKFVDIPTTIHVLQKNLATPRGIMFALLSGMAFLAAFSIRGIRWKLFLNPVGKVSTLKAIQLFLVGIFLNFLLPIRGGEVAKSLMLKRISNIPVSKSLPTVAMDKALDLMPALFIMAIVPFLGVKMDIKLWIVLGMVGGLLICLILFIALAAWKRLAAIALLQKLTSMLPKGAGSKIEGFATGFVDSLLAGASQPRIFIPAVLLTIVAVIFDGLFAMLAFWTVGVQIPFGTAIFGYTVYNMFYILPTPPGQVGSNEAIGLLVFYGLLHLDARGVTAMFFFSHPWAALIQCVMGMTCLSALGLNISSAMKAQSGGDEAETEPQDRQDQTRQEVASARV